MTPLLAVAPESGTATYFISALVSIILGLFALFLKTIMILLDEDKSAKWRARFYRVAYRITGKRDLEKKYISNDIKAKLNLARRSMHCAQTQLPKAIDVEWVPGCQPGAYDVKEGEFVVRLDPSEAQHKNIAILATLLVHKTTLQGIRSWMEDALQCAIDMTLIRKLLFAIRNPEVLDWFLSAVYRPSVNRDSLHKNRNDQIRILDERGFFTHLLLVELEEYDRKVFGREYSAEMGVEIADLVEFIYVLATRKPKEKIPLELLTNRFRIGLILVAKTGKIITTGTDPYVEAMHVLERTGLNTVYLLASDAEWLGEPGTPLRESYRKRVSDLKNDMLTKTMAQEDFAADYDFIDSVGKKRHETCLRYVLPGARF